MKRINVLYQNQLYSMAERELSAVESEISAIIASGQPGWLDANSGEGTLRPARLLITSGVSIALIPIDPEQALP